MKKKRKGYGRSGEEMIGKAGKVPMAMFTRIGSSHLGDIRSSLGVELGYRAE